MTVAARHLPQIRRILGIVFWLACAAALVRALWPDPYTEPVIGSWDKVVHATAFYVLTMLGAAAYPRTGLLWLALALAVFGGIIEMLQAIPALRRDADWDDWAADWLGIAVAMGPMMIPRIRGRLRV